MDLTRIDLNLMVAFEALMADRSVSAAAVRLGVSQPAMSSTLARLRGLFGDPLFVRSGRAMLPTVRALQLAGPVGQALDQLRAALEPPDGFDPARSRRSFTLSGGDYAAMVLLPRLTARLRAAAPGVDLRFRFVEKDQTFDLLEAEGLDLALGVYPDPPKRLALQPLLAETFVCIACRGNPALRGGMTLAAYAALPHLLITERADATGVVDEALRRQGLQRRVALTVPHVLVVPAVLPSSGMVATVGGRAGRMFAAAGRLLLHDVPVALPSWQLSMLWTRQRDGDPGLAWLRRMLAEVAAEA